MRKNIMNVGSHQGFELLLMLCSKLLTEFNIPQQTKTEKIETEKGLVSLNYQPRGQLHQNFIQTESTFISTKITAGIASEKNSSQRKLLNDYFNLSIAIVAMKTKLITFTREMDQNTPKHIKTAQKKVEKCTLSVYNCET